MAKKKSKRKKPAYRAHNVAVSVDAETHAWIKEQAEARGQSMGAFVRMFLVSGRTAFDALDADAASNGLFAALQADLEVAVERAIRDHVDRGKL